MLEILRTIFFAGAFGSGLIFLLALKNGSEKPSRWIKITAILAALSIAMMIVNDIRMKNNQKALEASPVVSAALKDIIPILRSDNRFSQIHSDGQTVKEPYLIVPIERIYNSHKGYQITTGDSRWSGGEFVSTEQADQSKTIIFYTSFVLEMPYTSSYGGTTTGRSETKTCYLYDVETRTLFEYKVFDTSLPSISRGTPNMKVSMDTVQNWIKERVGK